MDFPFVVFMATFDGIDGCVSGAMTPSVKFIDREAPWAIRPIGNENGDDVADPVRAATQWTGSYF